jgi:hypothetical protein
MGGPRSGPLTLETESLQPDGFLILIPAGAEKMEKRIRPMRVKVAIVFAKATLTATVVMK